MRRLLFLLIPLVFILLLPACEEAEEAVDNNNDIIVRNTSEDDLWIMIDGERRGRIENDGIAETMWDNIPDGVHYLKAFEDDDYTDEHCSVTTDFLSDGEDFYWYLKRGDTFTGTRSGDC